MANAYDDIVAIFRDNGLEELAQTVLQLVQEGYEGNALTLQLQESEAYKKRFAGNELRRKKGLAVLNPREYLEVESAYRQAMKSFGLPETFYSSNERLAEFMGKDLSPREVTERIQLAGQAAATADPYLKETMRTYYGINDDDLVAYFLDEQTGTELLKRQAVASQVGAAAAASRARLSRNLAEQFADKGVQGNQVQQALSDVNLDAERSIASRFGQQLSDDEVVASEVGLDAQASQKRRRLASQERALFQQQGRVQDRTSSVRSY